MIVVVNNDSRYNIIKDKDDYYIKNNSLSALEITLKQLYCNDSSRIVKTFNISSQNTVDLNIDYITGNIGIFVNNEDTYNTFIVNHLSTINNIVDLVEEILCGCNCVGCNDCNDDICEQSKKLTQLFTLILSYYIIKNPTYNQYFDIVAKSLKCDIEEDLLCQVNNLVLYGDSDNIFFVKRLVAYFYLMFYIQESLQSTSVEEAMYIKEKFKYDKIKKCINKLGIDPNDIIEEIMSGIEVKYWQYTNTVPDINTVIAAWTPTYLDTLPGIDQRPLEDFEQGVTIPYTNVGRVGFAIYPSQLLNYTILDSLGNDVTDNFDTHYFEDEETVVFVSKLPYSHSNIYFKFKKNIYV